MAEVGGHCRGMSEVVGQFVVVVVYLVEVGEVEGGQSEEEEDFGEEEEVVVGYFVVVEGFGDVVE